ncbi:hypothetical protein V8E53_011615, partial [Lactarius tabidus]
QQISRPYGAVDISANLKGAVPKPATQQILLALAEKGDVTQKTYGKATLFVANQNTLGAQPEPTIKALAAEMKVTSADLAKMRIALTDAELATRIEQAESTKITKLRAYIDIRSGTTLVSSAELETLDTDWTRWRTEWIHRRKVFYKYSLCFSFSAGDDRRDAVSLWVLVVDSLFPHDAPEHVELERGPLCGVSKRR